MAVCSETYMAVCQQVEDLRQRAEKAEARVAELEDPDQFWDADNSDYSHGCAFDVADYHGQDMHQGEEIELDVLCAKALPKRKMRVWINADDETDFEWLRPQADEVENVLDNRDDAWLLRKQAEAVEAMSRQWLEEAKDLPPQHENKARGCSTYNWQTHYAKTGEHYAQRLRQQADKLGKEDE